MTYKTFLMLPFALAMAGCGGATTPADTRVLLGDVDIIDDDLLVYPDRFASFQDAFDTHNTSPQLAERDWPAGGARFTGQAVLQLRPIVGASDNLVGDTFVDVSFDTQSFSGAMGRFQSSTGEFRDGELIISGDTKVGTGAFITGLISGEVESELDGMVSFSAPARVTVRGVGATSVNLSGPQNEITTTSTVYDRYFLNGFLVP